MGEDTSRVRVSSKRVPDMMKALVYDIYGTPEVLRLEDVAVPTPKEHEVLIEIHATSINSWDWDLLLGQPFVTRIGAVRKPRYRILGADVAGTVVAVGANAGRFRVGDRVFGDLSACNWGGFAEYVCASETALTLIPAGITYVQAAAIPQAAVLALQGLCNRGTLQQGQRILINGAGGGVGTFALQYAKLNGAEVTCVDRGEKLEMLKALGSDHVIDYRNEDYIARGITYDVILDVVGNHSVTGVKRALHSGGRYVMIGGPMGRIVLNLLWAPFISKLENKKITVLVHKQSAEDQKEWIQLVESGHIIPIIDQQYPLREAAQAFRDIGAGRVKGKTIVIMKE